MTEKEKLRIRNRDKKRYGAVPEGMQMHHIWYSEEYDPNSFIIVTPEEHGKLHDKEAIGNASSGFNNREYSKNYYYEHREECIKKHSEYNKAHKEQCDESLKKYRESHREEINRKRREYYKKMKHREKLIKLGVI